MTGEGPEVATGGREGDSPDENDSVLRFAVAMRGGVSLAVWIGGAMLEIDHLRRGEHFAHHMLGITRFGRLQVDILTGASAGGLNAALVGMAIAYDQPLTSLREVWMNTADIGSLLAIARSKRATIRSVLNGDYFRDEVVKQLGDMAEARSKALSEGQICGDPVEVFLATTVMGGVSVTEAGDPKFTDRRRQAYFHFRHQASACAFSDAHHRSEAATRLGLAARASASFPVAFDPVAVDTGTFTGRLQLPSRADVPSTLRMFDGGILDNIPVARAIRAAAASPAQESVRRYLVYLHPSPTLARALVPESATATPPHVVKVIADLVAGRGAETLLDDLEVLRSHNREAESQVVGRYSACEAAFGALTGDTTPPDGLASFDTDYLYVLLDDPAATLGWVPIGELPPESPVASLDDSARHRLRMSLLDELVELGSTIRPFARLVRVAHFFIEWIRWVESNAPQSQRNARREVYDILILARLIDAVLDRVFLEAADRRVAALTDALEVVRRSDALHHLATFLGCESGDREHLRERLSDPEAQATLDLLASGHHEGSPAEGAADLDDVLLRKLASVATGLLAAGRGIEKRPKKSVFTLLGSRPSLKGSSSSVAEICRHLCAIDSACAGTHRGRAVGAPISLDYVRISGEYGSPLVNGSAFPRGALHQMSSMTESAGRIEPREKLSGNRLANFGAFLSERFRANDWMWGRLDGVAGLVDILIRQAYLAEASDGADRSTCVVESIRSAVLAPFDDVEDPHLKSSAELVFEQLWEENCMQVTSDVDEAIADQDEPLERTRLLLTARWQLEILLTEVPLLLKTELIAGGGSSPIPESEDPGGDLEVASRNIKEVMDAYDGARRQVRDIWGSRRTTALGVRAARNVTHALVPGPGGLVKRIAVAVPIMVATGALLERGAYLVACSLLVNLVLVPRLATGSLIQLVVLLLTTLATLAFYRLLVRRRPGDDQRWRGWVTLAVVVAVQALGWAAFASVAGVGPISLDAPTSNTELDTPWILFQESADVRRGAVTVAVATGVAWYLLMGWARRRWAVSLAVLVGLLWGWWVAVGAWDLTQDPGRWQWLANFGSMWHPALLAVIVSGALTMRFEIEHLTGQRATKSESGRRRSP